MKKLIYFILVFMWMGFIFYMSSQSGYKSNKVSENIVRKVDTQVQKNTDKEFNFKQINLIIRKNAHFFEYAVLAGLIYNLLRVICFKYINIISFSICLLYSISDEIHQGFVPGRTSRLFDVFIDSLGAVFALLVICVIRQRRTDA
jgi:VanZ family protein